MVPCLILRKLHLLIALNLLTEGCITAKKKKLFLQAITREAKIQDFLVFHLTNLCDNHPEKNNTWRKSGFQPGERQRLPGYFYCNCHCDLSIGWTSPICD